MYMSIICPTVTASTPHEYREQVERLTPFAKRIHLDFMDGLFTANKSIELSKVWLPHEHKIECDLHLMYMRPDLYLNEIKHIKPSLVIVHAESQGRFMQFADRLHYLKIKIGVALLPQTPVKLIASALPDIDHVLIFSGDLGHFGGKANLALLKKAAELKLLKPDLEIGWDGGINEHNVAHLVKRGVDVLNVGGAIQRSEDPSQAYATLEAIAEMIQ